MCTLTWLDLEGGYSVAFNRDESRTRARGLSPRIVSRAGVRAACPIDAEAGGTWIAVNEHGCTLALLNGYRFGEPVARRDWKSRGLLVLESAGAATVDDALALVAASELARTRPFDLAMFDAKGGAALLAWDGVSLSSRALTAADRPLCSSAFDDAGARARRRELYARTVSARPTEAEHDLFHASHAPERGPYSPCMHREDASTESFTRVRVREDAVLLEYRPGPPCEASETARCELPRRVVQPS